MAVGDTLYALTTSVPLPESESHSSLQALSWAAVPDPPQPWDPDMEWCWRTVPSLLPPPYDGINIVAYALHPDGRTIFMSTDHRIQHPLPGHQQWLSLWKDLGDWVLPFRGQAYFDADLDYGYICCCPVASRSSSTARPPECMVLTEKLFRRKEEDPKYWPLLRGTEISLTYMGNSRFALVENVLRAEDFKRGSVLHVTVLSLKYDHDRRHNHKGELRCKVARHATRSYQVSKNTPMFSHAAFWM